jgi:hypothetical protein
VVRDPGVEQNFDFAPLLEVVVFRSFEIQAHRRHRVSALRTRALEDAMNDGACGEGATTRHPFKSGDDIPKVLERFTTLKTGVMLFVRSFEGVSAHVHFPWSRVIEQAPPSPLPKRVGEGAFIDGINPQRERFRS